MERGEHDGSGGLRYRAFLFNCSIIFFTLCNYVFFLPTSTLWVSWSVLVMGGIILRVIRPYWIWIEKSLNRPQKSTSSRRGGGRIVFLKESCTLLTRIMFQTRVDNLSMISSINQNFGWNTMQDFDWNAVSLLIPSAINVMICVTGGLVFGGKLGSMLCDKLYWTVFSMIVVDLMAEAIHRFDCGSRSSFDPFPQPLPKRHYVANILRVLVEGLLCYAMILQISGNPYCVDVNVCEAQCQERSRSTLMTLVALSGIQGTGAFVIPLSSCVLGRFIREGEKEANSLCEP